MKNRECRPKEGVIHQISTGHARIFAEDGDYIVSVPSSLSPLPGDNALFVPEGKKGWKIEGLLPRNHVLFRGNRRSRGEKIELAANFDRILLVLPAGELLRQSAFPEQAFLAAHRAGVPLGIFIHEQRRVEDGEKANLMTRLSPYRMAASFVHTGSPACPPAELTEALHGHTTVILGPHNSGKLSLLRQLLPPEVPCSPAPGGRLYRIGEETRLIDTAEFGDFAFSDITSQERNAVFPEIAAMAEQCRYRSCTHSGEDGCRVAAAIREGTIQTRRYRLYQQWTAPSHPAVIPKSRPDYRVSPCRETFSCKVCGAVVQPEDAGTQHRNHCPRCLSSLHVDEKPGDRACLCHGIMDPISVWVRKNGEWAIIHRCRSCGVLHANRIAADDNPALLLSMAVKPLSCTPFPLSRMESLFPDNAPV